MKGLPSGPGKQRYTRKPWCKAGPAVPALRIVVEEPHSGVSRPADGNLVTVHGRHEGNAKRRPSLAGSRPAWSRPGTMSVPEPPPRWDGGIRGVRGDLVSVLQVPFSGVFRACLRRLGRDDRLVRVAVARYLMLAATRWDSSVSRLSSCSSAGLAYSPWVIFVRSLSAIAV
jgi:hypothetical protein